MVVVVVPASEPLRLDETGGERTAHDDPNNKFSNVVTALYPLISVATCIALSEDDDVELDTRLVSGFNTSEVGSMRGGISECCEAVVVVVGMRSAWYDENGAK